MGPRSHERGNMTDDLAADSVTTTLQWGRVLTNAETSGVTNARWRSANMLQWGRVLTNAETGLRLDSGPRSTSCFNGAAFSRTRKRLGRERQRPAH